MCISAYQRATKTVGALPLFLFGSLDSVGIQHEKDAVSIKDVSLPIPLSTKLGIGEFQTEYVRNFATNEALAKIEGSA